MQTLFLPDNGDYLAWRNQKIANYVHDSESCLVQIRKSESLDFAEKANIKRLLASNNFFLYQAKNLSIPGLLRLTQQMGLNQTVANPQSDSKGISWITQKRENSSDHLYIPYSNKPLGWHTDGYYNHMQDCVRSFVLHCKSAAANGGENALLDHEMAYILLRDHNPQWAAALFQPDCFSIPATKHNDALVRPTFCGPVLSVEPHNQQLYMRYTQRKRHISWQNEPTLEDALGFLGQILAGDHPWIVRITLSPDQGIICNNVLHCRTGFHQSDNAPSRLLWRMRFSQRAQV